jgi:hypothetical protein
MCTYPHWTAYLSALLTPTLAVLGSLIAYRQWSLAQNKLKLDLFDRRFSVFDASRSLITSIMNKGKAMDEDILKFSIATREAKWLFNASLAEYLDKQLYEKAIDLQTLEAELDGVPAGDERSNNIYAQADIKKWFAAQLMVLDEKFSPYLQLQH